jgi:ubiquinone/menaquinone biosynthesis C-methylase UbiE
VKLVKRISKYRGLGGLHGSALGEGGVNGRIAALEQLVTLKGDVLVDVGCGSGGYTRRLAPGFDRVIAIDVEHDRLEFFRAADPPPNVEILDGSAASLPCETGSVDLVTAIEVVEHLSVHFDDVVGEIARVLKPGGVFALTTPNRWWPLEQHGWVIKDWRFHGVLFPFLTWIRPAHRRLSDASAFSASELDRMIATHGLTRSGLSYMWPPMDGHRKVGSVLRPIFGAMQKLRLSFFGQTTVATYTR